jgi:hypothetical protein
MASTGWHGRLLSGPELFPLTIDPLRDTVEFRSLPQVDYERASFLDLRLTAPVVLNAPYSEVAATAQALPIACDFIFHVGHVGSTLLSRVLGTHPAVFSLREPQALRVFAHAELEGRTWDAAALDGRLSTFLRLYSRIWAPPQRALIKATSLVGELAPRLLGMAPGSRAILLTVGPDSYLATILAGPNSRVELRTAAPGRLARLARRLGRAVSAAEQLSDGELAAASWACETAALEAAARAFPDRVLRIDFDAFLAEPARGLERALHLLHGRADPAEVARLAASPYFGRYSKAPEYAFGAEARTAVLDMARREFGAEIRRGLAWLEAAHVA